jgi:small-conductance mechanosensitive channel
MNFMGNSLQNYLQSAAIFAAGMAGLWALKTMVIRRLNAWAAKAKSEFDDFFVTSLNKFVVPLMYFGVFYVSLQNLTLSAGVNKGITAITVIIVTLTGIAAVSHIVRFALFHVYAKKFSDQADIRNRLGVVMPAITVAIWIVGVLFLLDNLGFEVSAIMAGLGIGGVAVALAAAVVLNDLFAYFAIMFDRPFVIGDFIIIGDFMGTIEQIGVKTTRIRSLGGELLVFSNKDLTDSRIRNYKRMDQRRIVFRLGVTYDTPLEKLREIPPLIKDIIEKTEGVRFDRAHFFSYGDFNLVIEVVYHVLSPDYNRYMDLQQSINFAIKAEFEKRKIEFAFPTQTVHLKREIS